jgi:hypothetical protein
MCLPRSACASTTWMRRRQRKAAGRSARASARARRRNSHVRPAGQRACALERDALQTRIAELETERMQRESEFKEVDRARSSLMERTAALARAFTAKEAALTRAENTIAALNEQVAARGRPRDRKTSYRSENRGTHRLVPPRADAVLGGGRCAGDGAQGFRPPDARGVSPSACTGKPDDPVTLRPANAA